jgi:hypothetical protein
VSPTLPYRRPEHVPPAGSDGDMVLAREQGTFELARSTMLGSSSRAGARPALAAAERSCS